MDVELLARALVESRRLSGRDRWTPGQLAAYQRARVDALRRWAAARSPFYGRHHAGLQGAPFDRLPRLTKPTLMAEFDDILTTPVLTRDAVGARLQSLADTHADPGRPWRGGWWSAQTSRTTGVRGMFVWDRREWATVLASYARATQWAGVAPGWHRTRMAIVSSTNPTHQSAVVGASLRSPVVPTLRLDAGAPMAATVGALNTFGPDVLVGYASALRPLAFAQLDGHLRIRPRAVMSASEVLSAETAALMTSAWGRAPFDVYAATETAGIASSCPYGRRHTYDDLVVIEPVDDQGMPVPAHTLGARLLVTVLFSRTLPLIRYELSDQVALGAGACPCGRPFGLLEALDGRAEDALVSHRPGAAGLRAADLRAVVERFPVLQWQVVDAGGPGPAELLVVPASADLDLAALQTAVEAHLASHQPMARAHVRAVPLLERTALGKSAVVGRRAGRETHDEGT